MHDIDEIRRDPSAFDAGLAARGHPAAAANLLELDRHLAERRAAMAEAKGALDAWSLEAARHKSEGVPFALIPCRDELEPLRSAALSATRAVWDAEAALAQALAEAPCLPAGVGSDVAVGEPNAHSWSGHEAWPEGARRLGSSGLARTFADGQVDVVLSGGAARLAHALTMLACDLAEEAGWRHVTLPSVRGELEPHRGLPAAIGVEAEQMLALAERREIGNLEFGRTSFAVCGPRSTVRGFATRDGARARLAPSAPSLVFLRIEDPAAPRPSPAEAFEPAVALLSLLGLPSAVTSDAPGDLRHHVAGSARLHAGGRSGGWIAAGSAHDLDVYVARRLGATRGGRPVRLVAGEALSVGAATASFLELGTDVPDALAPYMGRGRRPLLPWR